MAAVVHDAKINITSGPLESLRMRVARSTVRGAASGAASAAAAVHAITSPHQPQLNPSLHRAGPRGPW